MVEKNLLKIAQGTAKAQQITGIIAGFFQNA
jgi:hypothetical protein